MLRRCFANCKTDRCIERGTNWTSIGDQGNLQYLALYTHRRNAANSRR